MKGHEGTLQESAQVQQDLKSSRLVVNVEKSDWEP